MSNYSASYAWQPAGNGSGVGGPGNGNLVLLGAGSYAARIARIDIDSFGTTYVYVNSVTGTSLSGGSFVTPRPMRTGSPASTQIVKRGCTVSGTSTIVAFREVSSTEGVSTLTPGSAATGNYETPFNSILQPGSAINLNWISSVSQLLIITFYFEEPRLAYSL